MEDYKKIFMALKDADSYQRVEISYPIAWYIGLDGNNRYSLFAITDTQPPIVSSTKMINVFIGNRRDGKYGITFSLNEKRHLKLFVHFCEDLISFEYVIVCKLDDDCELEGIYQLDWDHFQKHKKWHSRMNAWNITITNAMKADSTVIYDRKASVREEAESFNNVVADEEIEDFDEEIPKVITWNKTEKVNHPVVREAVAEKLKRFLGCNFEKTSQSRYVSIDKASALFVLSASYSEKNGEYWYSINDENIPWLKLFPTCHIAFAMGGAENVLVFPYDKFTTLLDGCLRTKERPI